MTVREIVFAIAKKEEMTLSKIAEYSDMKQGNLSSLISSAHKEGMDMKVSTLMRILDPLGASLTVVSSSGKVYDLDGI